MSSKAISGCRDRLPLRRLPGKTGTPLALHRCAPLILSWRGLLEPQPRRRRWQSAFRQRLRQGSANHVFMIWSCNFELIFFPHKCKWRAEGALYLRDFLHRFSNAAGCLRKREWEVRSQNLSKLAWPEIRTEIKSASGFRLPWFLRRNPGWLVGNLGYRKIFRKCQPSIFHHFQAVCFQAGIECVVEFINIR